MIDCDPFRAFVQVAALLFFDRSEAKRRHPLTRVGRIAASVSTDTLPLGQMRVVLVEKVFDAPLSSVLALDYAL